MNLIDCAYLPTIGPHYLWHRLITGKYGPKTGEKTGRVPDRFKNSTTTALGRDNGRVEPPCLWVHTVSVGEAVASLDLVRMFMADNPSWELRVSTTTATGRAVAEKNFGADNVFYYPLDFSWMVRRAFKRIRPSLVVLMELEIWPNFLAQAAERGTPVVVANARITERSIRRLSWAPWLAGRMARTVDCWLAQTDQYADRLKKIGVPSGRIEVTGSVKYDAVPLEIDPEVGLRYRRLFGCGAQPHREGGDLLAVAGSTHPGEERFFLEALRGALPPGAPKPKVVLTPRHPERLGEVTRTAGEFGRVVRRSRLGEPGTASAAGDFDIVLVDTMGELAKIYAAADYVFVGGTLIRHGGQNFIEPCGLAKPTVVGPNLWNFAEPAELLGSKGLLRIVDGPEALRGVFADWLRDPAAAAAMGEAARRELLLQRGAARRMADRLNHFAENITRNRRISVQ